MSALPRLDGRLATAAAFVRGGRVADIGTDHAYLPAALLLEGKISYAVASDINEGPLVRATETVEKYRLENKITLLRTDGLHGVEAYCPEDIIVFGMGGELIASIIDAAPWVRSPDIRLILQPMTRAAELRGYLLSHGFNIVGEMLSENGGRIYQTVCAEFDGVVRSWTEPELLVGRHIISDGGELLKKHLIDLQEIYRVRRDGKCNAGVDTSADDYILNEINKLRNKQTEASVKVQ